MSAKPSSNLDLLRAFAVILVLAQHLLVRTGWPETHGFHTPRIGTFGVLLFFVHTCLVLMYSMQRSQSGGWAMIRSFYIRRFFRIYPLSMLAVLTAVALHLDSGLHGIEGLSRADIPSVGRIVSNLLLVQNMIKPGSIVNVLWSLPYEVQMYVFLPFLFLWISGGRRTLRNLCVLWIVSIPIALLQSRFHPFPLDRLGIVQYFPCFLPGIMAFVRPRTPLVKSYLWLPFLIVLTFIFLLSPHIATAWILCLTLGFAIPLFAEIQTGWLRWISNRIATYSYGIYLSHQFCIWLVFDPLRGLPVWSRVAVLISTLVAIPVIAYYAVEKPMITAGIRQAEKWNAGRMLATVGAAP